MSGLFGGGGSSSKKETKYPEDPNAEKQYFFTTSGLAGYPKIGATREPSNTLVGVGNSVPTTTSMSSRMPVPSPSSSSYQ